MRDSNDTEMLLIRIQNQGIVKIGWLIVAWWCPMLQHGSYHSLFLPQSAPSYHLNQWWLTITDIHKNLTLPLPGLCALQWHHDGCDGDGVSNHQSHDCLLNPLFRHRSRKTSKLHVTGLCAGNSPGTGEFPAQMASNMENVSIWWRHNVNWSSACLQMPYHLMV